MAGLEAAAEEAGDPSVAAMWATAMEGGSAAVMRATAEGFSGRSFPGTVWEKPAGGRAAGMEAALAKARAVERAAAVERPARVATIELGIFPARIAARL